MQGFFEKKLFILSSSIIFLKIIPKYSQEVEFFAEIHNTIIDKFTVTPVTIIKL